ncbi:hypothetical protein [Candidatus Electrothrix sp.]|uniref:hypothetical protein n=1 Tax=Candidatus Electrothrix sp. TaxID=2170559 RepID=UPI004056D861
MGKQLAVLGSIASIVGLAFAVIQFWPLNDTTENISKTRAANKPSQSVNVTGNSGNVIQSSGDNAVINTGRVETTIRVGDPRAEYIEFIDLLTLFTIPNFESYNVLAWDAGTGKNSPISWEFDGIREAPDWEKEKGAYYREGKVVITVNGKITHHQLKKTPEPVPWRIILHGPRMGVTGVTIDTNILSREMGPLLHDSKSLLAVSRKVKCEPTFASFGLEIYEVNIAGRNPIWLEFSWSCGSAGCSSDFFIMYSEAQAFARDCEDY